MSRSQAALSRTGASTGVGAQAQSIDARLRELREEVEQLELSRAALVGDRVAQGGEDPGVPSRTDDDTLDLADEAIGRSAVLADSSEMAGFLQRHLGQRLTAYLAGLRDVKTVGQWARGRVEPPAITRERLRAAFQATQLFLLRYSDEAAQGWFFGANSSLDDRAPAAVLRDAETPDELALIVPLARAFVRGAH